MIRLNEKSEVVPAMRLIPAPGHTPGYLVVEVASGEAKLLCIGDTALLPLHLERPDWLPAYDLVPKSAATSKDQILDLTASPGTPVVGRHFPLFPSLGTVLTHGLGWKWRLIEIGSTTSSSQGDPSAPTQRRHLGP